MNDRVARLQAALEEPLLVTDPTNVFYLVGFHSSNAALLVEPARVQLFTDFRYAEAARAVEGVEFVETERAVYGSLAQLLEGRVGFEASALTYANYRVLEGGNAELVPRDGQVERLRRIKDEGELDAMRRAGQITDEMYAQLAEERFIGRTERELAWRIEELFHELGADAAAFPAIVAGGANAARPHADPGDQRLAAGQTVVVDAGCTVDGYASDCTRTFATGSLSGELKDAYAACLEAQAAGVAAVRAGARGSDVDAVARDLIEASPFAGTFGHGLGHGVGLKVHEAPTLRKESEDVLEPGNVLTVEPGIYLSGRGGIRIEDLVAVTDSEPEVLTRFSKDLISVE